MTICFLIERCRSLLISNTVNPPVSRLSSQIIPFPWMLVSYQLISSVSMPIDLPMLCLPRVPYAQPLRTKFQTRLRCNSGHAGGCACLHFTCTIPLFVCSCSNAEHVQKITKKLHRILLKLPWKMWIGFGMSSVGIVPDYSQLLSPSPSLASTTFMSEYWM